GDRVGIASALRRLGTVGREQGDYAQARAFYAEALKVAREVDYQTDMAASLENYAILAVAEGQDERALRLAGAAAALRERAGVAPNPYEGRRLGQSLEQLGRVMSAERRARAWEEGKGMAIGEAIREAINNAIPKEQEAESSTP